jgi:Cu+-exporting ATPase
MSRKIDIPVRGMTCAACASAIERALQKVEGVEGVSVNFPAEKATVQFTKEDLVPLTNVIQTIKGEGYDVATVRAELAIKGMTCAACVSAVEKALRGIEGVRNVAVNLATEKASVEFVPTLTGLQDFIRVVREAGYEARAMTDTSPDRERDERERGYRLLKRDLWISGVLSGLVMTGSMVPIPVLSNWYVLLLLTTPVQFWTGLRFHRAAVSALTHGSMNMNTLISVGTTAAYAYSLVAILVPGLFTRSGLEAHIYFDTSATIITLILLGRLLEARAKGNTSEAIRKLMGLQVKKATVIRDNIEQDVTIDEVIVGDLILVRPGERVPVDG